MVSALVNFLCLRVCVWKGGWGRTTTSTTSSHSRKMPHPTCTSSVTYLHELSYPTACAPVRICMYCPLEKLRMALRHAATLMPASSGTGQRLTKMQTLCEVSNHPHSTLRTCLLMQEQIHTHKHYTFILAWAATPSVPPEVRSLKFA